MKNVLKNLTTTMKTFLVLSIMSASVGTYGDDTEVFYSVNVSKPNLLFVLDVSGSMGNPLTNAGTKVNRVIEKQVASSGDDGIQDSPGGTIVLTNLMLEINNNDSARFRFTNIDIPKDAGIESAYIQFESSANAGQDAKFEVYSENVNDAPETVASHFGGSYNQGDDWEVQTFWSEGDRGINQRVDVKDVLQDVINRGGWQANNAVAFYLDADEGIRHLAAFDSVNREAPTLHIEIAQSKIAVMKSSLRQVLQDSPDNVKVGLMNYGQESYSSSEVENENHFAVSGVAFPVTDINAKAIDVIPTAADLKGLPAYANATTTIREYIADIADSWSATSWTPIVDSLYEAALYMRGEKIHYGQTLPTKNGAHPSTYTGTEVSTDMEVSGRDRSIAPTYKTPIDSSCQENYIVLMTDGAPTYNINNDGLNAENTLGPLARIGGTAPGPQGTLAAAISTCASPAGVDDAGTCGAELTAYIATNDNLPNPSTTFPDGQEGEQLIKTFAIGFGTNNDTNTYLKSLATYDDGNASTLDDGYFDASTPEALSAAFKEILEEVAAPKGTLASPGYSVNVKNGLEHEKDIYIPVFDRKNTSRWSGNLKKFKIVDVDGRRLIRGKNNENATDELGNFTLNAIDYWSDATNADPDGRSVQKGGLANKLVAPNARKIYSNLSGDTNITFTPTSATDRLSIANVDNNAITNSDLGLASVANADYRKTVVNFMLGWKNGDATSANKAARMHMGDMLHSEPYVVTYDAGTSDANKIQYIFAGTNEGYLHAFDTNTGEEKFAFIPEELLSKLSEHQYLNAGSQADHKYGVDGVITVDVTRNSAGVASKVIVYFGLRRGGNSFYAMDVTNIDSPKLLWKRSKPATASVPAVGLDSMGQSWSTPYIAKVGMGTTAVATEAVFVSGGYDEDDDRDLSDNSNQLDDTKIGLNVTADEGNNIYIFRAGTGTGAGDILWSMPATMRAQITNSIPGGLRPLDTNYNGLIDRVYFADTGGNVWRLDLSETISTLDTSSVLTKIASLGGTGANNRMFFNEPDVTTLKVNGKNVYGIAIGSGFRAHPLDETINDKFFFLIDESPYKPLVATGDDKYEAIVIGDLSTITLVNGVVTTVGSITETGSRGWVVNLPNDGEKVLGTSIAFDGKVIFTSLVPEVYIGSNVDQCAAPVTQARIYAFNVITGKPGLDLDLDGDVDDDDWFDIPGTEIPGKPNIVFTTPKYPPILDDEGNDTGEVGCSHPVDIRVGKKLSQASGYEACRLESVYWSDPVKK